MKRTPLLLGALLGALPGSSFGPSEQRPCKQVNIELRDKLRAKRSARDARRAAKTPSTGPVVKNATLPPHEYEDTVRKITKGGIAQTFEIRAHSPGCGRCVAERKRANR